MQNFEKGVPFLVHLIGEIFIRLSSENSRKNVKKYYPIVFGTCLHRVISYTSSHFSVSSLFRHTQRAPFARIHEWSKGTKTSQDDV